VEQTEAKRFFMTKLKVTRGGSIQKDDSTWEKREYTLELNVKDANINNAKQFAEAYLSIWLRPFFKTGKTEADNINLEDISWHPSNGKGGPFERSIDRENPEFQKVVRLLQECKRATIQESYVWLFKDNKTLGRKPARR